MGETYRLKERKINQLQHTVGKTKGIETVEEI